MKLHKLLAIFIVLALTDLIQTDDVCAASKSSKNWTTLTENIDKSLTGSKGMRIEMIHSFGNMDILRSSDNRIHITGNKTVVAEEGDIAREFIDKTELRIRESDGFVSVETYYPQDEFGRDRKKVKKFTINYTISVPADIVLKVRNQFGNIDVTSISGDINVTNGYGYIKARDIEGSAELNNRFGSLSSDNNKGDLRVNNEHGGVTITDVGGNLIAATKFGAVEVNRVGGDVRLRNSHGDIFVEDVDGIADLETSFGSLNCSIVRKRVSVRNAHGMVNVRSIRDNATVVTSFAHAKVRNIAGDVSVENQHGVIEIENIAGGATAHTSFQPVNIRKVAGDVMVISEHGNINAIDILPQSKVDKRKVRMKTSFGTIKLRLPDTLSSDVVASVSMGKFTTEFPLMTNLQGAKIDSRQQNFTGKIGDGGDEIELECSNGNIYLEKSVTGNWDIHDVIKLDDVDTEE